MAPRGWLGALILAALAAASAGAGEDGRCKADTQTCLDKMAAYLSEYGWVGIEYDRNEETGALTVIAVHPDGPAAAAGLREGDVLLALNGVPLIEANEEKLYEIKQSMKVGKTITYTVDRQGCCHVKGGKQDVVVTLAAMPESVMAEWIGRHMLEHVAAEVARP